MVAIAMATTTGTQTVMLRRSDVEKMPAPGTVGAGVGLAVNTACQIIGTPQARPARPPPSARLQRGPAPAAPAGGRRRTPTGPPGEAPPPPPTRPPGLTAHQSA